MWRTRWWVPDGRRGDMPHPPLLLVFNGPRNPNTVIPQLAELTRRPWQGEAHDSIHTYDRRIPIIATGLRNCASTARPGRSSRGKPRRKNWPMQR